MDTKVGTSTADCKLRASASHLLSLWQHTKSLVQHCTEGTLINVLVFSDLGKYGALLRTRLFNNGPGMLLVSAEQGHVSPGEIQTAQNRKEKVISF